MMGPCSKCAWWVDQTARASAEARAAVEERAAMEAAPADAAKAKAAAAADFDKATKADPGVGTCQAGPPGAGGWPVTRGNDGCGGFKSKA